MTTQGQGPLNDPRLTERRGDLKGVNAVLFAILVIVAFVAAAYLLATVLHIGGSSASPTPVASPSNVPASPSVSATPLPSASLVVTPSGKPTASPGTSAAIHQKVDVVVGGHVLGTLTVLGVQYPATVRGATPGIGVRWLAARVRYDATVGLRYDVTDWSIVDAAGTQYPWAGVDFKPALGTGSVKAGQKWSGNVTFKVPLQGTLWLVFSGGDSPVRVAMPSQ